MSDLAHERLQVLDFEQSNYKPERGFHEISALEQGYVGIIVDCTVQRIRSFWRFEGRERAGLCFWEGHLTEENCVLRELLGDKRLRLNDAQRRRLAANGKALGRKLLSTWCRIVTPDAR